MNTDFNKHLSGIYKTLQTRFELINGSIGHSLTKGEENEAEIRKLLLDFLPSKFGVGSGIIVDTLGNESDQIDIIIYDKSLPNYTLSSESKIFLLDHVVATIEVKTRYTSGKGSSLSASLKNVQSVKKLVPCKKEWIEPHYENDENGVPVWSLNKYKPSPPVCIVFFYTMPEPKRAVNIDNFMSSVKAEISNVSPQLQPDMLFSLGHSSFYWHDDIGKKEDGKYNLCLLSFPNRPESPLQISDMDAQTKGLIVYGQIDPTPDAKVSTKLIENSKKSEKFLVLEGDELTYTPLVYRTCEIKSGFYFLDSYRSFICFISSIDQLLRAKKTNKSNVIEEYMDNGFFVMTRYNDGLDWTWKNTKD